MPPVAPTALPALKQRKKIMAACVVEELAVDGWAYCVTFSPEEYLVIGRYGSIDVIPLHGYNNRFDGTDILVTGLGASIVDSATGSVRARFVGEHKLGSHCITTIDDGAIVVTGGAHDPLVAFWDRSTGRPLLTLKPTIKGAFEALLVTHDGERMISVPRLDGAIHVWNTVALGDAVRTAAKG